MKKSIIFFLACAIILVMSACGEKSTSTNSEIEPETELKKETDIRYADLLPVTNDYFKNGEVTIIDPDGGTLYAFRIRNYTEEEYEAYIEKCKDIGFNDIAYEGENNGGKMFYAYSDDGKYYLQVTLGYLIEAIDVSCNEKTKDKSTSDTMSK